MITIRPIREAEVPAVKAIMNKVAYNIFGFDGTLEDSIRYYDGLGIHQDLEDVQNHYFNNKGIFLVAVKDEQVIGSGALRKHDDTTAELKRMWLLEQYQGQGIGYRLLVQLFDFARQNGYAHICAQASPEQVRALDFYRRIGFYEIPCYNDDIGEISLGIRL